MGELPESMLQLLLEPSPGPNGEPPFEQPNEFGEPAKFNGDGTPFQPQPPVPVNSWDNHEEHIHWHNHYRKTQEFELLPDLNKKAFELHVQLHQMALMANIVNQQGQMVQQNQQPQQEEPFGEGGPEEGGEQPEQFQ